MNEKSYGYAQQAPIGAISGASGSTSLINSGQFTPDQPPQLELPQVMQRLVVNCESLRLGPIMQPSAPTPSVTGKVSYGSPLAQAIDERNASLSATLEVLSTQCAVRTHSALRPEPASTRHNVS